ncbi:MAG TPA: BREX-1 system phosphatase PglZ type B [Thermoanaerobaculia bacterium]|nr:BREX-1 system phosphatase PglZ type B [Thermoanaerobaculia bacterium]
MTPEVTSVREETVLAEVLRALGRAGEYNAQDQSAPAAILWTDKDRQWEPLVLRLRAALPQLLTLGPYEPAERTGPAIWIKCMIERALPEANWPEGVVPILYLPGVSRHELRAVDECPRELQPLAELQYRGVWFTQENTKDWTVFGFLSSKRGGLSLEVVSDAATREAILHALSKLADTPVAELRVRRLQAADFQAILQPDIVRQLLRWLNAPAAVRQGWTQEEWQAFRGSCRERYHFDPEKDGELAAAEMLGTREGGWDSVWHRFEEAPETFPNVTELLRKAKPKNEDNLFFHRECWPQCNEKSEAELRSGLEKLGSLAPEAAAAGIESLETAHAARRVWVWAKLGHSPLARALEPLAMLARVTRTQLAGEDVTAMATAYAADGWRADAAVIDALACVNKAAEATAVKLAIQAVYKPWLEAGAERFQERFRKNPAGLSGAPPRELAAVGTGTCIVFADGLRLDLGKRLRTALESADLIVEESWRWAPLPPVTPTAKPAASPVADLVTGEGAEGEQLQPLVRATGQPLTSDRFRKLLIEREFQDLRGDDTGDPSGRAWTECGEIDRRGHEEQAKLARRVNEEIAGLSERIRSLFEAGWREVRVVTDHGWLLLPGGLPKVDIPQYLVESRWTRCGALKPGAKTELPTVPWYWNPEVQVALAPGIGSFRANVEYSHGSLSLQECVVPGFIVRAPQPAGPAPAIVSVRWKGLRCRVQIMGAGGGWQVDLRTKAGDAASSLAMDAQPRPVSSEGEVALVVDNPDCEGTAAIVVLLDSEGRVVARQNTVVGGDE